jgi:hypothetical protein
MTFNIVIEPESNSSERGCVYVILLFTFIPFILGLIISNNLILLSVPVGIILILIFNSSNKGKFNHQTWIKQDTLVFEKSHLRNEQLQTEFQWHKMRDLNIMIFSYDSQQKTRLGGPNSHFEGIENTIKFTYEDKIYEIKFYIRLKDDKKKLISYLREDLAPIIKHGKVEIFLNRYDGSRNYPISAIEKGCENLIN